MGRLVSPHHAGVACPCRPRCDPGPRRGVRKRGNPRLRDGLIPLTVPEVRRLLYGLIWQATPAPDHVLAWSRWRRRQQACAQHCHYRRRLNRIATEASS